MTRLFIFLITFICITKNVFANLMCNTDKNIYYALYKPLEYTCNPGHFLPANYTECKPCPSNYVCNGGTFKFNQKKFQGLTIKKISNTTINNACSSIFLNGLRATYKPNNINLDWFNGNEMIAQTSCTYDETITLPPEPTKPGYTFIGWKLKTNN